MVPVTVDFETLHIEARPKYPPVPVGVALSVPGRSPRYLSWGHPTKNNCTREEAARALGEVWASKRPLLFHHAKFDLDVAETHFGLPLPSWDRVHDTLFLLFLKDPHAASLSLKPSAARLLGMKPEEQDEVADWLRKHKVITAKQKPGAFISKAPGDIVGRYAIGDVVRTRRLFDLLVGDMDAGMLSAYDRERKLLPILLEHERQGIRVDLDRLGGDLAAYEGALVTVEEWLRAKLGAPGLEFDKDEAVAEALDASGAVKEWTLTPKSKKRSTSKKNIKITDREVEQALGYRNRLFNVLSQSMRPWYAQATEGKGYITTEWNQVRQAKGDNDSKGARTGRLSCSRFMNITKDYGRKRDGYTHPSFLTVPALPLVRRYLVPDPGGLWIHKDYRQQEFRILAHYEEGAMFDAYLRDPSTDYHVNMQARIEAMMGDPIDRDSVKELNFGILYGMGVGLLAARGHWDVTQAKRLRDAVKAAAPDVTRLERSIKSLARRGEPVREWGGGLIYCEPSVVAKDGPRKGERISFDYKVLNHLIQRSAASCTKEALIRYHAKKRSGRLLVTVHDEVNISAPAGAWKEEAEVLREVMESIEFDVPMLTDGKVGPSWGELKEAA